MGQDAGKDRPLVTDTGAIPAVASGVTAAEVEVVAAERLGNAAPADAPPAVRAIAQITRIQLGHLGRDPAASHAEFPARLLIKPVKRPQPLNVSDQFSTIADIFGRWRRLLLNVEFKLGG